MPTVQSLAHPVAPRSAQQSRSADPTRRRFLLTLGVGGAGAVVAAAGALPEAAIAQMPTASTDQDSAYRETEHVRDYYRTTRI